MLDAILSGGWKSISVACFLMVMSIASLAALAAEILRLRKELCNLPVEGAEVIGEWLILRHRHETMKAAGYRGMALLDGLEKSVPSQVAASSGASTMLASIGANAPYVGLFGTVLGVYGALTVIGQSAASLTPDDIAAPVGEALVMTALGLLVAIPAVFAFNYIVRQRSRLEEGLRAYAALLTIGGADGPHMRTFAALARHSRGKVK